jgi:hypothetical protein
MVTAVILILAFQTPDGSVRSESRSMASREDCVRVATAYVQHIEGAPPVRWSSCLALPAHGKDA